MQHFDIFPEEQEVEGEPGDWGIDATGDEAKPVSVEEAKKLVSVGALLNYIAPDRPELQYATKEILRKPRCPSVPDMTRLKQVVRFIIG